MNSIRLPAILTGTKAHPSITAKLQAARRQEPPKEPGKAKHHKSHEDR